MPDECSASIALTGTRTWIPGIQEVTMGYVNFPKFLTWTAKAHQEEKLPWNTRTGELVIVQEVRSKGWG